MNEFTKRALTGAVYVSLTIGAAIAGQGATFLLFLPVCLIGAREWNRLYSSDQESGPGQFRNMLLAGLSYVAWCIAVMAQDIRAVHASAFVLLLLVILAFDLMRRGVQDPARVFAGHLANVAYIALPFACSVALVHAHKHLFIGFMLLLWTSDTGAYLVGRAIGRTKLMPAVSPGKTWEGLGGGVVLTMLVGYLLAMNWTELSLKQWMLGAALVAITATLGDLLESAFKRARGVKDSGTVLSGHGGILDRCDGFLLAAPAMWMVVRIYG